MEISQTASLHSLGMALGRLDEDDIDRSMWDVDKRDDTQISEAMVCDMETDETTNKNVDELNFVSE